MEGDRTAQTLKFAREEWTKPWREALRAAVYHADNLQRVMEQGVVRDLDESQLALDRARRLLEEG